MKKIIFANWKMNPGTDEDAEVLARETDHELVILCPPEKYKDIVLRVRKKSRVGAQDISLDQRDMQQEKGIEYVIVGHSDRRHKMNESNSVVAEKFFLALQKGLVPILCVGETREEKEGGKREVVIREQVESAFEAIKIAEVKKEIYIAYEPVWAISTSMNAHQDTPENAEVIIASIKEWVTRRYPELEVHYIYGGSVNAGNIALYCKKPMIEGVLVGSASLYPVELRKMIDAIE